MVVHKAAVAQSDLMHENIGQLVACGYYDFQEES